MERELFLSNYCLRNDIQDISETSKKLISIFKKFLGEGASSKKNAQSIYYPIEIKKALSEPVDFQCSIINQKEACIRCIYHFLSKNQLIDALHGLAYLIHNYTLTNSFVWRTGFHILSRIGDLNSMREFFYVMLGNNVWDASNMYYEYMLFLMNQKEYSIIVDVYYSSFTKSLHCKRIVREPETDKLHHLIKLLFAMANYCLWKESLLLGKEDDVSRIQAALEFKELEPAIRKNMIVDSYLLSYLDLLEYSNDLDKALEILQLYHDKCPDNVHSTEYLLDFLIRNKQCLPQITGEMVSELRSKFVLKQVRISPESSDFIIHCFKKHVEDLDEKGDHGSIVKLLFDYLCDTRWETVEWPWRHLLRSIQNLGVSNTVVQESWIYIEDFWKDRFFRCPRNNCIVTLSKIM